MARKGISYDQVANAAQAIKARGQEPTIAAIRVEMGGEGSYTTISAHLAKWRDARATESDAGDLPPDEIQNSFMEAGIKAWNVAKRYAREEIHALKQEAADDKKKFTAELNDAAKEIASLEEIIKSMDTDNGKLLEQNQQMEKKLHQAQGELDATKKMYAELVAKFTRPTGTGKQGADTKQAHPKSTGGEPENKPGAAH